MPLSPEEEKQLAAISAKIAELSGNQSPKVNPASQEEPGLEGMWYDPIDLLAAPGLLKVGSMLGKAGLGAADVAQSKLAQFFGGKLAKMNPVQAEIYQKSPQYADKVVKMFQKDPAGLESMAQNEIKGALDKMGERAKEGTSKLKELLTGKSVPISSQDVLGSEIAGQVPAGVTSLPAEAVQGLKQQAQKAAKYLKPASVVDPIKYGAKREAEAKAASILRKNLEEAVPEVIPINKVMSQEARIADLAKSASKSPTSLLSQSLPKRALAQKLDELGGSQISKLSQATGLAKSPAFEPSNIVGEAGKLIGRAALKGSNLASKALQSTPASLASKVPGIATASALRHGAEATIQPAIEAATSPYSGSNDNAWTNEDEQQLQLISKRIDELSKR